MQFDTSKTAAYEQLYNGFHWNVPEKYNFGFDVVDKWAADRTKLALLSLSEDGEQAEYMSFFELSRLSDRFANVLVDLGLKKGDRVLIILHSIPQWYVAMIAMFKLGVVPMPGTVLLTAKDISYRVNRAEAVMVITDLDHVARVDEVARECPTLKHKMVVDGKTPGWYAYDAQMAAAKAKLERGVLGEVVTADPLMLYFTSGTTGQPKMVRHSHAYPMGHEVTARYAQSLQPTDLHWTVSETGWAKAAWGKLFGQMIVGAAIVQRKSLGRFNPENTLRALERYGVTTFCAPPTVYRMLIQQDLKAYDFTLRHCMSAGEPMNPEVIKAWREGTGLDIYDFYGQTETVCILSNYPFMPLKYGSVGKPTPGHDVRVVDENGVELAPGDEGHIAMYLGDQRPPGLMMEYWLDDDAMAGSFKGDYYYTGDRAYRDEEGYFWFVGRGDDIIKSSGYRVGPFEVESALQEHPAVAECAVVGAPDPEGVRGMVIKAFVVLVKGYEASEALTKEIQDYVKNTTAPYKYPRLIEYREELPKTISGKILRRELRKQ
ncbi:AMP-dependent synthetase and ligase [Desulfarculus baarsii DSM 2075]|uniref:AMP-dependent synthetase and ligase n=1 Tax=Desulfarculus baarsii (strain ATCC 33931 / DSM 2075 / LMG 7858 / VKM B-1802 / 2st14) TaxID=644282 RepID=E1QJX0_DESB2|nr:AMP-binding protein [Desulfarculus baarsii]ADK85863.1 AMP-dependent synthetase and ligase [Desulfarculus baarsii DSM 2075]